MSTPPKPSDEAILFVRLILVALTYMMICASCFLFGVAAGGFISILVFTKAYHP